MLVKQHRKDLFRCVTNHKHQRRICQKCPSGTRDTVVMGELLFSLVGDYTVSPILTVVNLSLVTEGARAHALTRMTTSRKLNVATVLQRTISFVVQ